MADPRLVTKPRCEEWAHDEGQPAGDRCKAKIKGRDGKLYGCGSKVVLYSEATGLPTPESPNVSKNLQVRGGRNGLSQAERSRRARVRKLERAIDRGLKCEVRDGH
jgi:hypothetical protein